MKIRISHDRILNLRKRYDREEDLEAIEELEEMSKICSEKFKKYEFTLAESRLEELNEYMSEVELKLQKENGLRSNRTKN